MKHVWLKNEGLTGLINAVNMPEKGVFLAIGMFVAKFSLGSIKQSFLVIGSLA